MLRVLDSSAVSCGRNQLQVLSMRDIVGKICSFLGHLSDITKFSLLSSDISGNITPFISYYFSFATSVCVNDHHMTASCLRKYSGLFPNVTSLTIKHKTLGIMEIFSCFRLSSLRHLSLIGRSVFSMRDLLQLPPLSLSVLDLTKTKFPWERIVGLYPTRISMLCVAIDIGDITGFLSCGMWMRCERLNITVSCGRGEGAHLVDVLDHPVSLFRSSNTPRVELTLLNSRVILMWVEVVERVFTNCGTWTITTPAVALDIVTVAEITRRLPSVAVSFVECGEEIQVSVTGPGTTKMIQETVQKVMRAVPDVIPAFPSERRFLCLRDMFIKSDWLSLERPEQNDEIPVRVWRDIVKEALSSPSVCGGCIFADSAFDLLSCPSHDCVSHWDNLTDELRLICSHPYGGASLTVPTSAIHFQYLSRLYISCTLPMSNGCVEIYAPCLRVFEWKVDTSTCAWCNGHSINLDIRKRNCDVTATLDMPNFFIVTGALVSMQVFGHPLVKSVSVCSSTVRSISLSHCCALSCVSIAGCPSLKSLDVLACDGLSRFHVEARTLRLLNLSLPHAKDVSLHCDRLSTLHLHSLAIRCASIISTHLRELVFLDCTGLFELSVRAPMLKILEIDSCINLNEIKITRSSLSQQTKRRLQYFSLERNVDILFHNDRKKCRLFSAIES